MKQLESRLIMELQKSFPGQTILEYTGGEYKTTAVMFEAGIYCCYQCGYLQPLELNKCKKCGEERFLTITRESVVRVERASKKGRLKAVGNIYA